MAFLYVIREANGPIKVGHSVAPKTRKYGLQNASSKKLTLIREFPCDDAPTTERAVHELLRPWKVRGEWFQVGAGAVDVAVEAVKACCDRRRQYLKLRGEADAIERKDWQAAQPLFDRIEAEFADLEKVFTSKGKDEFGNPIKPVRPAMREGLRDVPWPPWKDPNWNARIRRTP